MKIPLLTSNLAWKSSNCMERNESVILNYNLQRKKKATVSIVAGFFSNAAWFARTLYI